MLNLSLELYSFNLNEIINLVIDYRGKTPKKLGLTWTDSGFRALSAKNIKTGKIVQPDTIRFVGKKLYYLWMKEEVKRNDILITSEAPFGEIFFWDSDEKIVLSQRLFAIRCNEKKVYPKFIYFYMTSSKFQWELKSRATGTTVKGLRQSELLKCNLHIPNFSLQVKIAKILSNIEDKIKINEKINKKLDKILKEIFKNRFIRFEKYKKSNEMQINDEFGEIPKNWSVEMLEDYVDFISGIEPGSKNYQENKCDDCIPFIRVGDLGSRDNMVYINKKFSKNKLLKSTDIVLSLDATLGLVKIGLNGAYSTGMRKLVIKNNKINRVFLYCLVKSKRIQNTIENFATGTTILHAGKSIKHMNFVLPDEKTMIQFNKIGEPIFLKILENKLEIDKLTKLRDILLPKLMSGEINVSNIKI